MRTGVIIRNRHKRKLYNLLEALAAFDLWLLYRFRPAFNLAARLFAPMLRVLLLMSLGAGLLLTFALSRASDDSSAAAGYQCSGSKYLEIDDGSQSVVALRDLGHHLNTDMYLADFAAEAVGGSVVDTPGTRSYHESPAARLTIFGIPVWKPSYFTPRKVIQPWTQPGECWAFEGSRGKVEIELAYPAVVDRVTLEHIPRSASLTGSVDSAPRLFQVFGKAGEEYVPMGSFTYRDRGLPPSQIFRVKNARDVPFKRVVLEVLSNYGNPEYTCVYRFKVHGRMHHDQRDKIGR